MTINPGLRYERFVMSIPAQSAGAGTWVPARDFAAQDEHRQLEHRSRRGSASSWDMFGDGRTAMKGGAEPLRSARPASHWSSRSTRRTSPSRPVRGPTRTAT